MYQLYTAESLDGANVKSAKPVSEQVPAQPVGQPLPLDQIGYWMVRIEEMGFTAWFEPVKSKKTG